MTRHRKEDILAAAQPLFDQRGYHMVSLRDVADVLQISKGNLTYHFQKREDLIEACAQQTYQDALPATPPTTLDGLNELLASLVEKRAARPYYFYNLAQLPALCPQMASEGLLERLSGDLAESIRILAKAKVFRRDCLPVYEGLVQGILSLLIHGLPGDDSTSADELLICIWSMLVPCLTETGKKQYAALFA